MNPIRSRVALRERSLLDVLDLAVRFCATHARKYAKLSVVVIVPAFAASCAVSWVAGWWLGWVATVIITAFAGAPFVALASRLVFADDVGVGEAIRVALRALSGIAAVRALQAVWLGLSVFLFGLPWLWMGTILLFVVEVLLLERQGGIGEALRRSQRIASARLGPALVTMLLLVAVPIATAMVADIAGREVLGWLLEIVPPSSMFRQGGSWLAMAGWWATVPLCSTARFLVYLDIRTRTEGWDIQTRFAAIAMRGASHGGNQARRTRPTAALSLVFALLAVPSVARADVDTAPADKGYVFCHEPREPLTLRARALCAHAAAIPGCEGFAAACARAAKAAGEPTSGRNDDFARRTIAVPPAIAALARIVLWLLVATILGAVLVPVVRAAIARTRWRARATDRGPQPQPDAEASAAELPALPADSTLLDRADDLVRRGESAAALELYLAAALQALGERGAVHVAKHKTNGEYVRSCADKTALIALETMVHDVDRVQFGGEDPSAETVSRTARCALSIVRAVPAALLATAFAFGCGGAGAPLERAGDDPAGQELWFDVVRQHGLKVERLETALASLPMPASGRRSPAVVVDAQRTELDRETRAHLVSWVDAGGTLVLAGAPETWPREFGFAPRVSSVLMITARSRAVRPHRGGELGAETDDADLASGVAIEQAATASRVAWFTDGSTYAAITPHGRGFALGIATDELMTNVGLARGQNAAAMLAILSNADRVELRVAQDDDGIAPPTTPMAALSRAGLEVGLVHMLVASLVLFLAVGVRLSRPQPAPRPRSRAFAEHVEAVGALYAEAGAAAHALAAYARFAAQRLRDRVPRTARQRFLRQRAQDLGPADPASFLASRTHLPVDVCRRLWARAIAATTAPAEPIGDELAVLEELSAAYATATAEDP